MTDTDDTPHWIFLVVLLGLAAYRIVSHPNPRSMLMVVGAALVITLLVGLAVIYVKWPWIKLRAE